MVTKIRREARIMIGPKSQELGWSGRLTDNSAA
jgi:hypothetical protein